MIKKPALDWSDWDAESAGFKCESGVGTEVIIGNGCGSHDMWLSWDETVALYQWLGKKIERDVMTDAPNQPADAAIVAKIREAVLSLNASVDVAREAGIQASFGICSLCERRGGSRVVMLRIERPTNWSNGVMGELLYCEER